MDGSFAPSGFADPPPAPPASAAAQPPAAAWAYEPRVPAAASSPGCSGSSPSLKPSLSFEEGHPSQPEPDILQRQPFVPSHQLSGYNSTPQPSGLSGVFDASGSSASTDTKTSSVVNFPSAEARSAQAASSSGTTLLPQFRAPSWQTGMHSSAATELFVTGPLPTSGTLPPSALSAYQHPATFSNRNFATTSPLVLQDSTFHTTSNGILNPHDPLLQIKTSQGAVPTALAFEHLGSSALSNSIPPQSSTYRSAQESAPHLLQPQFSLLPSSLGGAQQTPQAYNSTLFSSSPASIERALLRECSVIKHHQRPSGTQSVQAQLTGPQHSSHNYLSSASVGNFQETPRQSSLTCGPAGDSTQVSNGGLQQKPPQVSGELAQPYSSVIPSSGYPSSIKVDSCSIKQPLASTKIPKPQSIIPPVQTLNYSKPLHNQSSVVSGQAQIYSTAQLPSLLSVSQSQNYGVVQPHSVPPVVHSQVYRSSRVEKMPSLYKTLTFSGSSQPVTSENQTLSYSSGQQEALSSAANENYPARTREMSSVSQSQSYSSGHSQGLSPVSQAQVSYSSQSQVLPVVSPSESYASGQSLTLTAPSLSYSSTSRAQNLTDSSSTPNYISMHSSPDAQTQGSSSPQPQKFMPAVQSSSFTSSARCQTLQNSLPSPDPKSYAERKLDSSVYTSSNREGNFPVQDLQAVQPQASLESSSQRLSDGKTNAQESIYKASKADDRYPKSVIRNNSRLEDQAVGVALQGSKKEENMIGSMTQLNQQMVQPSNAIAPDLKKATNLMQTPPIRLPSSDRSQQHSLMHKVHEAKVQEGHDQIITASSHIQIPNHTLGHSHQASLPNAQVLLDSACDLQILQQSMLQAGLGQAKASLQGQRVQSPQQIVHSFLQMDGHIIQSNGDHSQQQLHPQNSDMMKIDLPESSKPLQQLTTKGTFSETSQHDPKSQFVSLGAMCFPEAMLLSDERNILSNVDDILAATAAACGVTPSDLSKSASVEAMQAVEGGDSKSHFQQPLDIRHVNSEFNSMAGTVGKPQSISDISLNGNQVPVTLSPAPTLQSKMSLDQQHIEKPSQNLPTKAASVAVGPSHEVQEQSSGPVKKQSAVTHEAEDNEVPAEGALSSSRNQEFISPGRSISAESAAPEGEFALVGDNCSMSVSQTRNTMALLAMAPPGETASIKTDSESQEAVHCHVTKRKGKGKGQTREEDGNNQKHLKRSAQGKRQHSRGADMYLPYAPASSENCHEGYQHQERMRQKIKEVEEKQPEVKTGFIASFLDFLKCGPKQQFSTLAVRMPNRTRRPGAQIARTSCPPTLPRTSSTILTPIVSETSEVNPSEKADNELKNLEHFSSLSSDEEDPGACGHKSIATLLTASDATSDKAKKAVSESPLVPTPSPSSNTTGTATTSSTTVDAVKQELLHASSSSVNILENISSTEPPTPIELYGLPSDHFAKGQDTVAIEGFTDEENTESGGEGQYRERDEFVVKIEDIETFKEALKVGTEPPAIWKVQKALLQKFVPELRDGQREFAATNSYLGYFGDAKTKYKRIYVKFIENANKKEYVRVCSKKPRNKPSQTIRAVQAKSSSSSKTSDPPLSKTTTSKVPSTKPKVKQLRVKAEPPPKKRKKWKEEFSSSQSDSSAEVRSSSSEDEEFDPPAPFVARFLNTRAMKETFKSYMELLVSIALDPDTMQALEKSNDELLLPHMKKIDGMLNDNRKRLLLNLHLDQSFKNALESFPELTIITRDSKSKSGGSTISKIKMNGKTYNKKTLRTSKSTTKSAQEFAVDPEKIQLYSLYHSLHHYKYHVYLICKDEISSVQKKNEDLGQEEIVQLCMKNVKWVEDLFEKFGELLSHVQQKCS